MGAGVGVGGVVTLGAGGVTGVTGVGVTGDVGVGVALGVNCAPLANLIICSTSAASGCPLALADFAAARQVDGTGVPAVHAPVACAS